MSWTVFGYRQEDTGVVFDKPAQYVPDVMERVREAIQAGCDHVVVLRDPDA